MRIKSHISQISFFGIALLLVFGFNCKSSDTVTDKETITDSTLVENPQVDSLELARQKEKELRQALIDLYKDEVYSKYQSQANTLTNYYILAQQNFYTGNYENALYLINRAALIKENADILSLRGNIYLALGYVNEFVSHWRRALEMDPAVPIPQSAYIIQQLQYNGLIDENLKKSF